MLSIIVCSVSPKKLEDFKANVEKTIGIKAVSYTHLRAHRDCS